MAKLSQDDQRLLSEVRKAAGATNDSVLPPSILEEELEAAKVHLSDELRQSLSTDTLNFYEQSAAEDALFNFLCLRTTALLLGGEGVERPRTVSSMRRFGYDNSQERFWRDRVVRALNRLTE